MPRVPSWLERFGALDALPDELIDRATVERVLCVEKRRALQIMENLPCRQVGTSKLVSRAALLDRLRAFARGEAPEFEVSRREHMAQWIQDQARDRIEHHRAMIEAPITVVDSRIAQLPAGVTLERGRIAVSFDTATEACERLLALAMAIGNDPAQFEELVSRQ